MICQKLKLKIYLNISIKKIIYRIAPLNFLKHIQNFLTCYKDFFAL